jgi:hypothetical protein
MRSLLLLVVAVLLVGCPPSPAPPPSPDASDATVPDMPDVVTPPVDATPAPQDANVPQDTCSLACANLRAFGCREGAEDAGAGCTAVCRHTVDGGAFSINAACLAAAKSAADVHACGTVKCSK